MTDKKNEVTPLVNKVAQSGLITIDLLDLMPNSIKEIDISQWLFKGLVLREKDFRQALKDVNWDDFQDAHVGLYCSTDAIIPKWAYMLIASYLKDVAANIVLAPKAELKEQLLLAEIRATDFNHLRDKKVIIKGCGEKIVSDSAYLLIANKLLPVVQSLMFGEACSTVPIYKKKK